MPTEAEKKSPDLLRSNLRGPIRSLFNWLSGTANHAGIHLTEFRHLGHMVVIDPFGVLRLDFYCLLKRLDANELLPSADGILEAKTLWA